MKKVKDKGYIAHDTIRTHNIYKKINETLEKEIGGTQEHKLKTLCIEKKHNLNMTGVIMLGILAIVVLIGIFWGKNVIIGIFSGILIITVLYTLVQNNSYGV